jgi:tRNA pseudouridine55 synthase
MATGVLPLACGRATRLVRFLVASTKDYEAAIRFGATTDSFDLAGEETSRSGRVPSAAEVNEALDSFRGDSMQVPPAFSAKKISGERAYALARQKRAVALPAVRVHVSRVELVDLDGDTARITLTCSAGFYVRAFAHDLGDIVGTGACLSALRRTRSGEFTLDRALSLQALQEPAAIRAGFVPMTRLLGDMVPLYVTEEGRTRTVHGRDLRGEHLRGARPDPTDAEAYVRLIDESGQLIAIGAPAEDGALHPAVVLV